MKRRNILILGASQMQVPAIKAAKDMGWTAIVADANPLSMARDLADHFEQVDLADPPAMAAMARRYKDGPGLDGVFTAGTDFSATVAFVAEQLGLPGNSHEAALNASIKSRMRACFAKAGVPSPKFLSLGRDETVDPRTLDYPLVVKPVDSMGARGASKVSVPADLGPAIEAARVHSRQGRVIIESFIEGPEYSIDSLLHDGVLHPCGIARRHIAFPPFFVELGHTLPSDLSDDQCAEMARVLHDAAKACGLTLGAVKGDIFWTDRGPVIGEIAARLSGGYMSGWTFPYASGVELTRAALLLAVGEQPGSLSPLRSHTSAERALVSIPGRVRALHGLDTARSIDGIRELFLRTAVGQQTVFPRNNVEKSGNVIAVHPDRQTACTLAERAVRAIHIELEPLDPRTLEFLEAPWHAARETGPADSWPAAYPGLAGLVDSIDPGKASFDSGGALVVLDPRFEPELLAEVCPWDYRSLHECLALAVDSGLVRLGPTGAGKAFWHAVARGGFQGLAFAVGSYRCDTGKAEQILPSGGQK